MNSFTNKMEKLTTQLKECDENIKKINKSIKKLDKKLSLKISIVFIIFTFFLKYLLKIKSSFLIFKENIILTKLVGITTSVIIGTTSAVKTIDYQIEKTNPIMLNIPVESFVTNTIKILANDLENAYKKKIIIVKRKSNNKFIRGKLLKITLRDGAVVNGTIIKKTNKKLILLVLTPKKQKKIINIDFIWRITYD